MATQVPTGAVGGDDLLSPAQGLLRGLSILPEENALRDAKASAAFKGAPDSVSIIEAGGTALSKGYAGLIALLGGGTAVATAVSGFWEGEANGVRVTLVGGSAVFLAAAVIAIAIIVASDVGGRANGSVAQYQARSAVAVSVLELSLAAHRDVTAVEARTASAGGVVWAVAIAGAPASVLRKATGVVGQLSGIRGNAEGQPEVQITRSDGIREWCTPSELELRELTF
jgi:hypothetical protein